MAKFSINLAYGLPEISTESPIKLQGFKSEADKLKWIVEKATHNYSKSGGLTTQLDLEAKIN
jgi:phage protein D